MTGAELPTGDELVPHLDGFDDDLLAAYVRGLLEHFELKASSLDPYDATTLSDFADMPLRRKKSPPNANTAVGTASCAASAHGPG